MKITLTTHGDVQIDEKSPDNALVVQFWAGPANVRRYGSDTPAERILGDAVAIATFELDRIRIVEERLGLSIHTLENRRHNTGEKQCQYSATEHSKK